MNKNDLKLIVGENSKLEVSPNPTSADISDETITWKSENTKVATVDKKGVVTAVGKGTTKIVAMLQDFSVECKVTVAEKINLKLKEEKIELPKQQNKSIVVTTNENLVNKTIEYHSENESIAKVDKNGKITAVDEGTTQITVLVKQKISDDFEIKESSICTVIVSGKLGDVDGDNNITAYDAYKALEASNDYASGKQIDEQILLRVDANRNGIPEEEDAYSILKHSIEGIDEF